MEGHPYILARALTVYRNKVWKKYIHTFLPGPSLSPGTKYGRSTSIHSCQGPHCLQEQSMEEAHPLFLPGPSLIPGTKYGGSTSIILARAFTVSRNIEWKNIHTFLPGSSLNQGTKKASISIHSCLGLHCFQEQSMEEAHPYILV